MIGKALILRKSASIPDFEPIEIDENLTDGQVLVQVMFSGLCSTQIEEIFVSSRNQVHIPHLFGHEGAGRVLKVGPGVRKIKEGDLCVMHWKKSSEGLDSDAGNYRIAGQKINAGKIVTFASHAVVSEARLTKIPENFPSEFAALMGCSITTGWGALTNNGRFKPGNKVAVVGVGGVGLSAAIAAKLEGASEVTGVDSNQKLFTNRAFEFLDECHASVEEMILHQQENFSTYPDIVIDTTGVSAVFEALVDWLPTTSRIVLVGMPRLGLQPKLNTQKLLDGLRIEGSNGGESDPARDVPYIAKTLALQTLFKLPDLAEIQPVGNFQEILHSKKYLERKFIFSF